MIFFTRNKTMRYFHSLLFSFALLTIFLGSAASGQIQENQEMEEFETETFTVSIIGTMSLVIDSDIHMGHVDEIRAHLKHLAELDASIQILEEVMYQQWLGNTHISTEHVGTSIYTRQTNKGPEVTVEIEYELTFSEGWPFWQSTPEDL